MILCAMTRTGMRNSMSDITSEIKKRRTFAIISHPDAGKTTLTEKFLLYEIGRASCRERV